MGKPYSKREVSRLLSQVRQANKRAAKEMGIGLECGSCNDIARVVRQMRRDLAERTLRPIASAPMDGTKVLCWSRDSGCFMARFDGTYWLVGIGAIVEPTHWMPLPDGPGEG